MVQKWLDQINCTIQDIAAKNIFLQKPKLN